MLVAALDRIRAHHARIWSQLQHIYVLNASSAESALLQKCLHMSEFQPGTSNLVGDGIEGSFLVPESWSFEENRRQRLANNQIAMQSLSFTRSHRSIALVL